MNIYKTAVNNPITTILVFIAVALFGIFSLVKLPIDFMPRIDTPYIMVITAYPGASAEDIEENVSKPLENSLNGVDNLKHISSKSKENISTVFLQFEYGTDNDVATNDVRDKLDMAKNNLPDEANTPILFKFSTDEMPIMLLSVKAEESWSGLYKIIDEMVATPLARVSGVGTVSVQGIPERQIQVYCDPYKLEAYGMTIEGISQIISAENRAIPGGQIDVGSNTYSMRVDQEFTSIEELKSLVIGTRGGANIYLRDVATVTDTEQERAQEVYNNGERTGLIVIQKQTGANAVQISKDVKEELAKITPTLPSDIRISQVVDTADNILDTANSLVDTILTTFIVVMFVVMMMLGRWRAMFIIILTIPISMLSALIYLLFTDQTLNVVTMSSLSISIGMVVDNAIVVLENITTHVDRGSRVKQAAIFATKEVGLSIIASTLTTLAVFLPLTMIDGMAGVMFTPMGWMVTITLTVSMAAALTFTPVLCSLIMKQKPKKSSLQKYVDGAMGWLDGIYEKALHWCVTHRKTFLTGALVLFVGTFVFIAPAVKTEFFPMQDNGRIAVKVKLPVGTRQEITRDVAMRISNQFRQNYPEITVLNATLGVADTDNAFASIQDNGTHYISFNITLTDKTERERSLAEIGDLMRKDLDGYSEIRTYEVVETGQGGGAGGQSKVDIELYGYDFEDTDRVALDIKELMLQVPGCTEVTISRDEYTPEYQVLFDREKLSMHGLNVATAGTFLRNRINGATASYFREEGEEYDILVRYDRPFRESLEEIENITLYNTTTGAAVKVRDVATVVESQTPPAIDRKDRSRYVKISGSVGHGYAMSDIVSGTVEGLNKMDLPAGITWKLGGSYEDQMDTFMDMGMLLVLMVILVYVIMASQFESLSYPFIIMFSLPFAVVGVMLGLWATNTALGVMGLLGVLMLVGIVVNNGIVLVDYTRLLIGRKMPIIDAVVAGGKSRLRPILMTTLTTVLGMVPMAVGNGVGSEMWNSLGMVVATGLTFSTLVTLFLIPVLFTWLAMRDERKRAKKLAQLNA
ncbi:MAG: efflux RND transporter permease subunit [Rikenellaceae bacterium]|nr:efflux RND transporter permease subunit [Rikenellaceae bacterium]